MPGTVLKINVAVGDTVSEGQAVVILEAMKMENEIAAPSSGTVASIVVSQGASVNSGDVLITLN
jgi:biotin carboxyl carrier protein